jgi:predicted metal-binding membrane protein
MRVVTILAAIARVRFPQLLLVSLAGWWLVLLGSDRGLILPGLCSAAGGSWLMRSSQGIAAAFVFNSPTGLILPWLAMLAAMMPPLLVQQIGHLWDRSFVRRRLRAITLFVLGYGAVWMAAGFALTAAAIAIDAVSETVSLAAPISAVAVALLWQSTPAKQQCLNRCHRLPRLSAFGVAADFDCLHYGLTAAVWCVGACWALMLVPLLAEGMHVLAMAAVAALVLAERLAPARPARWRFPFRPHGSDRFGPRQMSPA